MRLLLPKIRTYMCVYLYSMHVYIYMNKRWYFTKTCTRYVLYVVNPHYLQIPYLRICLRTTTFLSPPHQHSRCSRSNLQTWAEWWHIRVAWTGMLPAEGQRGNSSALFRLSCGGDWGTGTVGPCRVAQEFWLRGRLDRIGIPALAPVSGASSGKSLNTFWISFSLL